MQECLSLTQKENNEIFSKLNSENETKNGEITKLYESVVDLRRQLTEATNETKAIDMKELPLKLIDMEGSIKELKVLVDNFMGGDLLESEGKGEPMTIKEFVSNTFSNNKIINDKLDKVNTKVESFNSEVLQRIRKELMNESNSILDNFKLDLRSNLHKIQDQMRDKVDKLNMDELVRKIDLKIINEVSRKLDRNDMKRNNNVINKKVLQVFIKDRHFRKQN